MNFGNRELLRFELMKLVETMSKLDIIKSNMNLLMKYEEFGDVEYTDDLNQGVISILHLMEIYNREEKHFLKIIQKG